MLFGPEFIQAQITYFIEPVAFTKISRNMPEGLGFPSSYYKIHVPSFVLIKDENPVLFGGNIGFQKGKSCLKFGFSQDKSVTEFTLYYKASESKNYDAFISSNSSVNLKRFILIFSTQLFANKKIFTGKHNNISAKLNFNYGYALLRSRGSYGVQTYSHSYIDSIIVYPNSHLSYLSEATFYSGNYFLRYVAGLEYEVYHKGNQLFALSCSYSGMRALTRKISNRTSQQFALIGIDSEYFWYRAYSNGSGFFIQISRKLYF